MFYCYCIFAVHTEIYLRENITLSLFFFFLRYFLLAASMFLCVDLFSPTNIGVWLLSLLFCVPP
jgi:hypothetical protein